MSYRCARYEETWGSGGKAPFILIRGSRRRWLVSFTPRTLCPGEQAVGTQWTGDWTGYRASLDAWRGRGRGILLPLLGIESLFRRPGGSLVTMLNKTVSVNPSGKMDTSRILCEPYTKIPFGRTRGNTVCPIRYRTRHFFNNSNTNEDIATKFEQEYVRCVRN